MTAPQVVDSAAVRAYLLGLQQRIVDALQVEDGKPFISDHWTRAPGESNVAPQTPAAPAPRVGAPGLGQRAAAPSPPARAGTASRIAASGSEQPGAGLQGGGLSQLVEDGGLLERGGCNFSDVTGTTLPPSATQHRPELAGAPWQAMGVSLVMHPRNPYVPTVHMNVRMFAAFPEGRDATFWFGGGMDLTPYYGFEDDARHFHRVCREALDAIDVKLYPRFKTWCDEYFFLKHRNEPRGIGGVFFDDFSEPGFERSFATLRALGDAFLSAYLPIVQRRRTTPYGERERDFQAYRRGRYVEFNLVWDRGTLFGLQSGGRTESILMSMPPVVKWRYDWKPEAGSVEARLYSDFLCPRDWLGGSAG